MQFTKDGYLEIIATFEFVHVLVVDIVASNCGVREPITIEDGLLDL